MSGFVPRAQIPTVATVRPCARIAPEALTADGIFAPVTERYGALTEMLPLVGAAALRRDNAGEIALVAHLRRRAPWLEVAISAIDAHLRVQLWAGRPWLAWRPLCLAGPPGSGKSHLARLIGTFAGNCSATLDIGSACDARTLEGTARGWAGTQPCWPAVVIAQTRTANPVLVLEEVDKAGGSRQGRTPHEVLLTMIERETAAAYWDKCLLADVDLSHVCWLLTCNDPALLPPTLRSRLDIVTVVGPGPEHFELLVSAILADLAYAWTVPFAMLPELPPSVRRSLRTAFTQSGSVRRLWRHVEAVVVALLPLHRDGLH